MLAAGSSTEKGDCLGAVSKCAGYALKLGAPLDPAASSEVSGRFAATWTCSVVLWRVLVTPEKCNLGISQYNPSIHVACSPFSVTPYICPFHNSKSNKPHHSQMTGLWKTKDLL